MRMETSAVILTAGLCLVSATGFADMSPKQIYAQDAPAVVLIMAADQGGKGELGSGSIIDGQGHVLTNAHVVTNKATGRIYGEIDVYFKPERLTGDMQTDLTNPVTATVVASNRGLDLALLSLNHVPSNLRVMSIGDSSQVSMGDPVVAIGHPEEGGLWTMTSGIVSTVMANLDGVTGKNVFQTDASINRGNSGGPLIDRAQGAMIGVNTSMARKAPDGLAITSVNFSIESGVVKRWLASVGEKLPQPTEEIAQAQNPEIQAPVKVAAQPQPAPTVAQAVAQAPASSPGAASKPPVVVHSHPMVPAPAAEKPMILTPEKPYNIQDLIAQKIKEMERLGQGMQQDINNGGPSTNGSFNELDQNSKTKIPNNLP